MPTLFRHILWGYELAHPDHWIHQEAEDADAFAPIDGEPMIRVPMRSIAGARGVELAGSPLALWNQHIGLLAA
jgi:hypothetical protein